MSKLGKDELLGALRDMRRDTCDMYDGDYPLRIRGCVDEIESIIVQHFTPDQDVEELVGRIIFICNRTSSEFSNIEERDASMRQQFRSLLQSRQGTEDEGDEVSDFIDRHSG